MTARQATAVHQVHQATAVQATAVQAVAAQATAVHQAIQAVHLATQVRQAIQSMNAERKNKSKKRDSEENVDQKVRNRGAGQEIAAFQEICGKL